MKNEMELSGKVVGDRSRKPQRKVWHPAWIKRQPLTSHEDAKIQTMLSYQDTQSEGQDSETSALPGLREKVQGLERRLGNKQLTEQSSRDPAMLLLGTTVLMRGLHTRGE